MTTLLISNPPRRNKKGQFVKGASRKKRRRSSTAKRRTTSRRRRRRTVALANPPRRRRRSSSSSGAGKLTLRKALPQAAAGLAGYTATDFVTSWVVSLPQIAAVTSKIPPVAAPAVKGAFAIGLGESVRRFGPRQLRKFGHMVTIGGLISAGIDAIAIARARRAGMSGYWSPGMEGYWSPGQAPELGDGSYGVVEDYTDRMERMGLGGPAVILDTEDL